jgi:hypothetical protein
MKQNPVFAREQSMAKFLGIVPSVYINWALAARSLITSVRDCGEAGGPNVPIKNNILISLSESDKTQFGKQDFESQSTPQKIFSAIWAVESEVNNGGFSQYFLNDSCETAAFVAEALEAIGAPRTADICRRAIAAAFPAGLPKTSEAISASASEFSDEVLERLQILDNEFFAYPHDLTDLLFAYVSKHPGEFGALPKSDD